jgi:hypothetical protein
MLQEKAVALQEKAVALQEKAVALQEKAVALQATLYTYLKSKKLFFVLYHLYHLFVRNSITYFL